MSFIKKNLMVLGILCSMVFAQQTVEVSDVIVTDLGNGLLKISVEVKNTSTKTISEIAGYIDIYDNRSQVIEKQEIAIVLKSDVPLKPQKTASRNVIVTQRPNMSGNVRLRITSFRFFGDPEVYLICPACGELILKD